MEGIEYLHELCEALPRCGPGDNNSTRRAYNAIPKPPDKPFILDIGCGTGMQTLELARISNREIIALDNHQGFLDILMKNAIDAGLQNRIIPKNMSMLEMDFANRTFDLIWSEGALFCMGFQNGLKCCHELLEAYGYLAVTELVYIASDLPDDVTRYFERVYPDIKDIQGNIEAIREKGFNLVSNFTLPESAWLDNYYIPSEKVLPGLNKKYQGNEVALDVFEDFQNEINLYKKYSKFYGYEFFIMQKINK